MELILNNGRAVPDAVASAVAAGVNPVKAMREFVGYSIEDLAVTCGLANDEIVSIEAGDDIGSAKLRRVAHALGLNAESVISQ